MLFIIFGWKTRTKDYGPTYPTECPHCHNEQYFQLVKSRRWFSLYFIPVLPLSLASHQLVCPICTATKTLHGRAEATEAKQLAEATTRYKHDQTSVSEYQRELSAFEADALTESEHLELDTEDQTTTTPSVLRMALALLFVFGLWWTLALLTALKPAGILYALLMLPYLAIRYRDPDSTTLPFTAYVQKYA